MESADEFDAGSYEDSAQDQGADDSPEEHAMLLFFGDSKVIEDHQKDKKIVDAERQLEYISCDKFEAGPVSLPVEEQDGKGSCQSDVERTPAKGFPETHHMARTMKNLKVQDQHAEREDVEDNPEEKHGELSIGDCRFSICASSIGNWNSEFGNQLRYHADARTLRIVDFMIVD